MTGLPTELTSILGRKVDTVFLDLDGVVADFDGGAQAWYGCKIPEDEPREWTYKYREWFGMSGTKFWDGLTEEFWATLPKLPWADDLVGWLEDRYTLVFLTSPPLVGGASGKQSWIRAHYPKIYGDKRFLIGPGKSHVARPSALLIDDHEVNVAGFRQAGGKTVLFPQPWNRNRAVLEMEGTDRLHYTLFQVDWLAYGGE